MAFIGACVIVYCVAYAGSNICMLTIQHPDHLKKVLNQMAYKKVSKNRSEVIVNAIDRSHEVISHQTTILRPSDLQTDSSGNSFQSSQVCESILNSPTIILINGFDDEDVTTNDDLSGIPQPSAKIIEINDTNEFNLEGDSLKMSKEYESKSDSPTIILIHESDDEDVTTNDYLPGIPQPTAEVIEINNTNEFNLEGDSLKMTTEYESISEIQTIEIDSNTHSNNIINNDAKPSDIAQPTPMPIQINRVNDRSNKSAGSSWQTFQVNELQLPESVSSYNLNCGIIAIVEFTHSSSNSIGTTKQEISVSDNPQISQENKPQLTSSKYGYNLDMAAILGPSGKLFNKLKTDLDVEKLSADNGTKSKIHCEDTNQYVLSKAAHVSLCRRDRLLGEVQNLGNSTPCMDGAALSSMKRTSSCDGNDENSKKFCTDSQVPYNVEVDCCSDQNDSELSAEGLLMSSRMQLIVDNALNTVHQCILNDPFVDDSWCEDAQMNMHLSLQDYKK